MRSMTDEGMMGVFWAAKVEPLSATASSSSDRFAATFSRRGEGKFSGFDSNYLVYFPIVLDIRINRIIVLIT